MKSPEELTAAYTQWVADHPEAKQGQCAVVFGSDAAVIGPFDDGKKAMEAAFTERPNDQPHICTIGEPLRGIEVLKGRGEQRGIVR